MARASSIIRRINFLVTIIYLRPPNKGYFNIPLYNYAIITTAFLLVLSLPVLACRITILLFDRNIGTSFFDPSRRRDAVLFQHLFWFFRHPEVYVLILPRFGIISQVINFYTGSNTRFRYFRISWSILSIRFLRCIV